MSLRILLVAATQAEADVLKRVGGIAPSENAFLFGSCELFPLITGVGSVATSRTMTKWFSSNMKPDLAVNIGIAGSFRHDILIGSVVMPVSDCFADAGNETAESFQRLGEAGLQDPDSFPFSAGKIIAENKYIREVSSRFRGVDAITVNSVSGSQETIDKLVRKYNPDIETMEGATFFYICSGEKIPFLALRSISNRVEPRNRDNWNIPLALENLSENIKILLLLLK
jgi:futalosine hydrolase